MKCQVRPRRARIVTWTKRPSEIFSTTCAPASSIPTRRWPSFVAFRSPTSASRGSITTAPSGRVCPRRCTGRARRPSSASPSSASCSTRARVRCLLTRVDETQSSAVLTAHPSGRRAGSTIVWNPLDAERPERVLVVTAGTVRPSRRRRVRRGARGPRDHPDSHHRRRRRRRASAARARRGARAAPTWWSSSRGWRARSRASSAGSRRHP